MIPFHRDVYDWCRTLLSSRGRPFVVGMSGPQGSGKTTLAQALVEAATADGLRAVAISIDDFYWTRGEQMALAARFPDNRFLAQRGHPGTHDVALGERTLAALKIAAFPELVAVPSHDKAAHAGRGDRRPEAEWSRVAGGLDLIILEGWMLGFPPVTPNFDAQVNACLAAYAAWHRHLDAFLLLRMQNDAFVVAWRVEAEQNQRRAGRGAMSDAEARAYVELFLPAYALYPAAASAAPPVPRASFKEVLLGPDRMPC